MAVVFLLNWYGAIMGLLLVSLVTLVASTLFAFASKKKTSIMIALLAVLFMSLFVQYSSGSTMWNIQPAADQGKELSAYLSDPKLGAKIVESRWTSFGRVELVESDVDPHSKVIFVDGGAGTSLYHFDGDFNSSNNDVPQLRYSTQYFPYNFVKNGSSLVIGPGGGLDVLTALMSGSQHIYAVEVNPGIVDIVRDYSAYDGGIYTNYSNVHVSVDEGRSFLKRSNQTYDSIMLDIPVSKTAQGTFGYALSENYLFTKESFDDYLNHLTDEGYLSVVAHNSQEVYKLVSIAYEVLGAKGLGPQEIMKQIAVVGKVDKMGHTHSALPVFMLKKTPITIDQASQISDVASTIGLDNLYTPLTVYSQAKQASTDEVLTTLAKGGAISNADLFASAPFNIKAPTDDNPFFYNFERGIPSTLQMLLAGAVGLPIVVSILYFGARRRPSVSFVNGSRKLIKSKFSLFRWFCFGSLGLGFMLIEVALIQKFILFIGEPTTAIAASLFSLLIAGGLGSFFSMKWSATKQHYAFKVSLIIAAVVLAYIFILPSIFSALLSSVTPLRFLISFMMIFPLGFLMGIPFPTLLGYVKKEAENDAAWMWCINGAFSVLAGTLAIVVAMSYGFNAVLLSGALTYLGIFVIGTLRERNSNPEKVRWINPRILKYGRSHK